MNWRRSHGKEHPINPHSLYLRNVRTFDEVRLDLPEGLLAVIGSNGAGKSTLISAIDVALFGPEGRSLAPWYPRGISEDPLTIELVFEHDDELYRVRRSFYPKGRGLSKLEFDRHVFSGANAPSDAPGGWDALTLESQTATEALIESTIGLSRATFRASSYLAQGQAGVFCDAAPRDRKAVLAEVVGLAEWDGYLERARNEKRAYELEIAEKRAVLERAETELAQRDQVVAQQQTAARQEQVFRTSMAQNAELLTAARETHTEATQRAEKRAVLERAHTAAKVAVEELRVRIDRLDAEVATLDARLALREGLAAQAGILGELQDEQMALQAAIDRASQRNVLLATAMELQKRSADNLAQGLVCEEMAARVVAGVGEEHCDRCNQILGKDAAEHAAESYRREALTHRQTANEALAEMKELSAQIEALPDEQPDHDRLPVLHAEIRQAQETTVQLAALDEAASRRVSALDELGVMRAELPTREAGAAAALADVEALGPHDPDEGEREAAEVQRLEREERLLRERVDAAVVQVARCSERLERLDKVAADADASRERVEKLLTDLEVATAMERACGANGIPALILESVAIPQVEAEASRLLRVLGGPATSVELRTQRETKTGGISDTLDIVLNTETGEAPYESFSGGERARIAFALRLALAQLLSGRKGADTGLLIVDEIDGLDSQGIAALVGVLEELQTRIPRIIVVSHDLELRDAFPQSLTLENIDGRSQILDATAAAV